jgi:hypothetical protein
MTAGLIVVNRFQSLRRGAANRALKNRLPALGSSDEDVARRYRGFDGVVWPRPETPFVLDERDLAAPRDLEAVKAYRQKQDRPDECEPTRTSR